MLDSFTFDTGLTTGGAGVSTATSPPQTINGRITAIALTYDGSPPAGTTDVVVRVKAHGSQPVQTLLTVTNAATDGWFYPTAAMTGGAAGDLQGGIPVAGEVEVVISQANDNDGVRAVVLAVI